MSLYIAFYSNLCFPVANATGMISLCFVAKFCVKMEENVEKVDQLASVLNISKIV